MQRGLTHCGRASLMQVNPGLYKKTRNAWAREWAREQDSFTLSPQVSVLASLTDGLWPGSISQTPHFLTCKLLQVRLSITATERKLDQNGRNRNTQCEVDSGSIERRCSRSWHIFGVLPHSSEICGAHFLPLCSFWSRSWLRVLVLGQERHMEREEDRDCTLYRCSF